MNFLLKRILIRQILMRGLFVLALLAISGLPGVSAQTTLPSCTMSIPDTDGDSTPQAMDIDKDGDGLIEICDLEGLDEMRHRLNGSGYRTTAEATVITSGCPDGGCTGYELTRHLNFMSASSYRDGSINTAWTDTSGAGWDPIGNSFGDPFAATFEGNGYTISNLMINRGGENGESNVGLFLIISWYEIANLGLLNVNITGLSRVGGLVGQNRGIIINSYVTGKVTGTDRVGGLAGVNVRTGAPIPGTDIIAVTGIITNSYTTGMVTGTDDVGGLVGRNDILSFITNSYATGMVTGTGTNVGGLVGENNTFVGLNESGSLNGIITNSYATGMVTGTGTNVGGLVGLNGGIITNNDSYWLRQDGSASSGGTGVAASTSRTMTELQEPTTTSTKIYTSWLTADWDFRSPSQYPALRYAKATDTENPTCSDTPPQTVSDQPQCGGLLANQEDHELPPCTASLNIPDDDDGVIQALDVDKDGDGLIEICDLEGLFEMRYQLDGMGYTATDGGTPITTGCATTCTGFELTKDLDFEEPADYRPGSTNQTAWTMGDGWQPIGNRTNTNAFAATFNGNGYAISNLMIDRSARDDTGLFGGAVGSTIANLGLLNVNIRGQRAVGGLVGFNNGTVTNSYVTGSVVGIGAVGGLVGGNIGSSSANGRITNSFASASVIGDSFIGGLVGINAEDDTNSTFITNSYATGAVSGPGLFPSNIGGLVGQNGGAGAITNSYATGAVSAPSPDASNVGGLVGLNEGEITNDDSYWLRQRNSASSGGTGVAASTSRTAMELASPTTTAMTIYADWDPKAWDFGNNMQYPALKYATDCVEPGTAMSDAGPPICRTVLLNQEVDLQRGLPPCTMDIPDTDNDGIEQSDDVDKDGDGLIEICDLEGLNEMRFMLDGSGYRAAADAMIISTGCPSTSCTGFELMRDLDFNERDSYRSRSINTAWTTGQGWQPIGPNGGSSFKATFNGNGYTISNLMINRSTDRIGLFGYAQPPSGDTSISIANLGLLNVNTTGTFYVGSLIGQTTDVMIINSYATGSVVGTDEFVGGLVGRTSGPTMNSYAAVSVSAPNGDVGGLIGHNFGATITNSYATGTVGGTGDNRGGLVGFNQGGTIRNSYATGRVIAGSDSNIGGLVGLNSGGTITASYWDSQTSQQDTSDGGTVGTTMQLQRPTAATGIYTGWGTANWDFGTSLQYPILKYANDNLMGSLIVRGSLIPGQGTGLRSLQPSTAGAEFITIFGEATAFSEATTRHTIAVPPGTSEIGLTLTAYNSTATIAVVKEGESNDFFAGMGSGDNVSVPIATNPVLIITVTEPNQEPIVYRVVVTALPSCTFGIDVNDTDEVDQIIDIDKDGDGLIEICDLEGLDEMRHQLDGMGYNATDGGTAITAGCPSGGCTGYELANSLDFMD